MVVLRAERAVTPQKLELNGQLFLTFSLFSFFFNIFNIVGGEGQNHVRLAATVSHVEARIIAECITKSCILKRRALRSLMSRNLYENGQVLR